MPDETSDSTTAPAPPAPEVTQPPAPPAPAPPAPEPDEGTYDADKFSRDQLINHARTLVGAEPYVVEVALRHAGGADFFTKEEAQAAVKVLLESGEDQ